MWTYIILAVKRKTNIFIKCRQHLCDKDVQCRDTDKTSIALHANIVQKNIFNATIFF